MKEFIDIVASQGHEHANAMKAFKNNTFYKAAQSAIAKAEGKILVGS